MVKPIVAITMGDPAGVGPEVVLKALADRRVSRACHPLVLGDMGVLQRTRGRRSYPELVSWEQGQSFEERNGVAPVYSLTALSLGQSRPGDPSPPHQSVNESFSSPDILILATPSFWPS
jgi:4-hydroxythreonine-4-phosphate dehydrogenase